MTESFISLRHVPITADGIDVNWFPNESLHCVGFLVGFETRVSIYLTDADARALHDALGKGIKDLASKRAAEVLAATIVDGEPSAPEFCPDCGHTNGHGLVHRRNTAGGGGSNVPCPNTEAVQA
ncbi:hypothetical protein OG874_00050 [Nocardia sp. NBC_00565]|uniref:hypothetical protein n=1 Tax=Nocardia sp. NBC_00565 TaxID=2975993 RepID=UPI002E80F248|nr:hypothetical protein [Nocardia sp. NBC_00565]WUC03645.1 hypothetical protein OG874_00050 [Nocardia sp. NBC_00565]